MKRCPLCADKRSEFERCLNNINLLKCESCGFVYANLAAEYILQVNSSYDLETKANYEMRQTFLDELWFRRIAEVFTKKLGGGRVLDVGCGNGLLLRQFRSLHWNCCGVDPSPWSKEFAEKYGFELIQGTLENRHPEIGEFDLVVSSSTLEHIAEPVLHVQAVAKVVKKGGYAYFCGIPNYSSASVRLGFTSFYRNKPPGHVNYFTPRTLERLLAFAGVPVKQMAIRTYGAPELHSFYKAATRFLHGRGRVHPSRMAENALPPQMRMFAPGFMSAVGRTLSKWTLSAFYHIGTIGSAGEKLEAMIWK